MKFVIRFMLQAWVIRIMGQSQFQDWENNFCVDRRLLGKSVEWILNHQTNDGSFKDPDDYFPS